MSTVERRPPPPTTPLLVDGQRLGQVEFMRRYELTPPGFTAELIGGVVCVASPLSRPHGRGSSHLTTWLGVYCARTPGTESLADATTLMDELGVPQPDTQLRILPECGGQSRDEGEYIGGAPELVGEVARSSRLHRPRRQAGRLRTRGRPRIYCRGHRHRTRSTGIDRRGKKLVRVKPDPDGLYRSKVFPGLWLDPAALLRRDIAAVLDDSRRRPGLARARRLRRQAGRQGGASRIEAAMRDR